MGDTVLVVDDEVTLGANVARALERAGHTALVVNTGRAAIDELSRRHFDLVITDLRMPDGDGMLVLDHARSVSPDTIVLVMTAYASVDSAVEALRRGAHDYLLKPLSLVDLVKKVDHVASYRRLALENARLRSELRGDGEPFALLSACPSQPMRKLCELLTKTAASSSPVLVRGESGAGKELVARAVHDSSPRRDGPFLAVNVSAVPDATLESLLFGSEKTRSDGLLRAAQGGTIFLDEVAELSTGVQAKLLRVLETREVVPVGGERPIAVDARVVCATHEDLSVLSERGTFRKELLFRLSVLRLDVPALRDRSDDVRHLALSLARRHGHQQSKRIDAISARALDVLARHAWPGNVRELSNVMERAVLVCEGTIVELADLPFELLALEPHRPGDTYRLPAMDAPFESDEACNLETATRDFERVHIARVLARTAGNREAAAKLLGLSLATLYRHLQRTGLKGYLT
jgi:DNA-binding NtrC family response regulator